MLLAIAGVSGPVLADPAFPPAASPPARECGPDQETGRPPAGPSIRETLAAALLRSEGESLPPEPSREASEASRRSFFRSGRAAVIYIVAGALIVGSVARNSILEDS